jgi:hypothetical protein
MLSFGHPDVPANGIPMYRETSEGLNVYLDVLFDINSQNNNVDCVIVN